MPHRELKGTAVEVEGRRRAGRRARSCATGGLSAVGFLILVARMSPQPSKNPKLSSLFPYGLNTQLVLQQCTDHNAVNIATLNGQKYVSSEDADWHPVCSLLNDPVIGSAYFLTLSASLGN
ncbi:hypothetical protein GUJ93_ZPchr0008g14045 [Zizania palustris]|uniref:Uncharacterized protein n=1 Tax=Zizania palustris TaxID=103762 RepID=A0A8J5UW39_ZIZPA|nr:hypothetical protein GUJ93_ZPchr0008g14045 [Zizania palustris]